MYKLNSVVYGRLTSLVVCASVWCCSQCDWSQNASSDVAWMAAVQYEENRSRKSPKPICTYVMCSDFRRPILHMDSVQYRKPNIKLAPHYS